MTSPTKENEYAQGQEVQLRAVFTDPETETVLLASTLVGALTLPVRSGLIGKGFAAGAQILVGEQDVIVIGLGGGTSTAIPLATALPRSYPPGTKVQLINDPGASVVFKLTNPLEKTSSPTPVLNDSPGVYHVLVKTTLASPPGTWYYRAEAGEVSAGKDRAFTLTRSRFSTV